MSNILFWRSWPRPYNWLNTILFILLICLISISLLLRLLGPETLIGWSVLSFQTSFPDIFNVVEVGPFSLEMFAQKFAIKELFEGGQMPSMSFASLVGIVTTGVCLVIYLAAITYFKRFWYLLGMATMMLFLIFLHPESVGFLELTSKMILSIYFIILFIPSYYLHAFIKSESFAIRLLVSFLSVALIIALVFFFSQEAAPFRAIYNYGFLAPLFLVLAFTITVSHEIMRVFLKITAGNITSSSGRTRLRHFLMLSMIYWIIVLLSYLNITNVIDWDIVLDPFLLLGVSTVFGFWGLHNRVVIYEGASESRPIWSLIYLVLGIISFTFIAFLNFGLNDPAIRVVGDFIIYAHVSIGMAFLLYVVYNFMSLIEKGYDAEKVLYSPTNLPYFTYRLIGVIGIIALVSMRGLDYPIWYSMGGYYNTMADHQRDLGDKDLSKIYYAQSADFAFNNHKANYSLAQLTNEGNNVEAKEYYLKATRNAASPQAFVNLALLQDFDKGYFKSVFTLQEGAELLSEEPHIGNNLAMQFEAGNMIDSAEYYLTTIPNTEPVVNGNKVAFNAKYKIPFDKDSVAYFKKLTKGGITNASLYGVFVNTKIGSQNGDNMFDGVSLNNWFLSNQPSVIDSSLFFTGLVVDSTVDVANQQALNYALALANMKNGAINSAVNRLQTLIYTSSEPSNDHLENLSITYMSQGAFELAMESLTQARENGSETALFKLALCQSELGRFNEAIDLWERLQNHRDPFVTRTADLMVAILADSAVVPEDDNGKFVYAYFHKTKMEAMDLLPIIQQIGDVNIKTKACLQLIKHYHKLKKDQDVTLFLNHIPEGEKDVELQRMTELWRLKTAAAAGLSTQHDLAIFSQDFGFEHGEYLDSLYILANLNMADSTAYKHLGYDNAFFVDGILVAAEFFKDDPDEFRSYGIIIDAIYYNPNSSRLRYQYTLAALELGFTDYAENALNEFKERYSEPLFNQLLEAYEVTLKELDEKIEPES